MKKRLISAIFMAALLVTAFVIPTSALKSGDPIGDVLYTNVKTFIDGYPIESYNIAGNTYIVAEDLMQYGFHVEWDGATSRLIIHLDRTATPDEYTATFKHSENKGTPGMPRMKYLYTEVTTWIGDKQIEGFNIGGYTCIWFDELAPYFAAEGGLVWDGPTSTLRLTTKQQTKPGDAGTTTPAIPSELPDLGETVYYKGWDGVPDFGAMTGVDTAWAPVKGEDDSMTYSYSILDMMIALGGDISVLESYLTRLTECGFAAVDGYTDETGVVLLLQNDELGVNVAVGVVQVELGYFVIEVSKM